MFLAFMALFDLLVVALVFSLGLLVIRAVRYGRTRLVYERFLVPVYERWEPVRGDLFGTSMMVDGQPPRWNL